MKNKIVIIALCVLLIAGCVCGTKKEAVISYHADGTATVMLADGSTIVTRDPSPWITEHSVIMIDMDAPNVLKAGQLAYFDGYFLTNYDAATIMGGDPTMKYKKLNRGEPAPENGYLFAAKLLDVLPDGSVKIK